MPACSARRRRAGGGKAFPPFGIKPNIKAKQFSIPFKRKKGARKIQKIERKLFCFARRNSAGGNAGAGLKVKIGIFVKKCSDFVQKVPPVYNFSVFEGCCLALATLGLGFRRYFEGEFEIQKQFLPAQTEVRFAESKHKFEKFINQSFFFRQRRKAKR